MSSYLFESFREHYLGLSENMVPLIPSADHFPTFEWSFGGWLRNFEPPRSDGRRYLLATSLLLHTGVSNLDLESSVVPHALGRRNIWRFSEIGVPLYYMFIIQILDWDFP